MNKDRFWIGQVPPYQDVNKTDPNRWGSRVKVRILGVHPQSGAITPDNHLDYAMVLHPNTHGSLSRGHTGIIGGEMVFGMFLNREGDQWTDPIILGVIPRTLGVFDITAEESKENDSTEFKRIQPYWGNKIQPQSYQIQGGSSSESQEPTKPDAASFGLKSTSEGAQEPAAEPSPPLTVDNLAGTGNILSNDGVFVTNFANQITGQVNDDGTVTLF